MMLYLGIALAALGLAVCHYATKADNDGAWTLYGCTPIIIGGSLIAAAILGRFVCG